LFWIGGKLETENKNLADALGQPIWLGNSYGYSTSASGVARTVFGEAIKCTESGKVTLRVEQVKRFLYGKPINEVYEGAETISIRSHMLFPV
jgi:hypothetical protein